MIRPTLFPPNGPDSKNPSPVKLIWPIIPKLKLLFFSVDADIAPDNSLSNEDIHRRCIHNNTIQRKSRRSLFSKQSPRRLADADRSTGTWTFRDCFRKADPAS